jgi:hypothetical protein
MIGSERLVATNLGGSMTQIDRIRLILQSDRLTTCQACGERHLNLGALDCPYCGRALNPADEQSLDYLDEGIEENFESFDSGNISLEEGDLWS